MLDPSFYVFKFLLFIIISSVSLDSGIDSVTIYPIFSKPTILLRDCNQNSTVINEIISSSSTREMTIDHEI